MLFTGRQTMPSRNEKYRLQVWDAVYTSLDQPSTNQKYFYIQKQQYLYPYFGEEMCRLFLPILLRSESESLWGGAV